MTSHRFRCYVVRKDSDDRIHGGVEDRSRDELPPGDVLLRVRYSSLNYKDALAATGNPAIAKTLPHVPGIDAVGTVLESSDSRFQPGQEVIATGHEFGVERWGGWSELMTCPAKWLVPLPEGLSPIESMSLGTAGFTAAQCVQALLHQGVTPSQGEIVVSGATGGVASIAIMLLSKLGFRVVAVTGKADKEAWLKEIGASEVAGRELLTETKPRPLQSARFAGGIDTVGGAVLTTMCKMIVHRGCVACCGMAGGNELSLTVFPFILRGLTLSGIDSAWCPDDIRTEIWKQLAGDWKLPNLETIRETAGLSGMTEKVDLLLKGGNTGRVVVDLLAAE